MAEHDKKNDAAVAETLMQGSAHPDIEIFADGVFNMWLRSGVLKIDLYQSAGIAADGKGEFRRLAQRVSLPVTALGELKDMLQKMETAIAAARNQA